MDKAIVFLILISTTLCSCSGNTNSNNHNIECDEDSQINETLDTNKEDNKNENNSSIELHNYIQGYPYKVGDQFYLDKDYSGTSANDFIEMAMRYNYSPSINSFFSLNNYDSNSFCCSGRFYSFSYNNYDIFAESNNNLINTYKKSIKKKFTEKEAIELGFFSKKRTITNPIYYDFKKVAESTEISWISNYKMELNLENIMRFGAWDSLMCFLDRGPERSYRNGLNFCVWPAISIYSDDLSEVIGVSLYTYEFNNFLTFLKQDGYSNTFDFEYFSSQISYCQENNTNFGRAAFYLTPEIFEGPGDKIFYELMYPNLRDLKL
ncbi:MAG: hypothetical protein MJZ37_04005 [Bacilli bacterium]|nr:hypothetical protein [Bacilli bacterium]